MATVDRNVFVSYCHEDDEWLKRLKVHLRPLIRLGLVDVWDDTRISPGLTWEAEITNALSRARVAVLLVSADFLASDFLVDTEIPALLHRAAQGGVLILPVVVGPCLYEEHEELSRYQSVNSPEKPLSSLTRADSEAILVSLARSIDKYFRFLDSKTTLEDEELAVGGLSGGAVPANDPSRLARWSSLVRPTWVSMARRLTGSPWAGSTALVTSLVCRRTMIFASGRAPVTRPLDGAQS